MTPDTYVLCQVRGAERLGVVVRSLPIDGCNVLVEYPDWSESRYNKTLIERRDGYPAFWCWHAAHELTAVKGELV